MKYLLFPALCCVLLIQPCQSGILKGQLIKSQHSADKASLSRLSSGGTLKGNNGDGTLALPTVPAPTEYGFIGSQNSYSQGKGPVVYNSVKMSSNEGPFGRTRRNGVGDGPMPPASVPTAFGLKGPWVPVSSVMPSLEKGGLQRTWRNTVKGGLSPLSTASVPTAYGFTVPKSSFSDRLSHFRASFVEQMPQNMGSTDDKLQEYTKGIESSVAGSSGVRKSLSDAGAVGSTKGGSGSSLPGLTTSSPMRSSVQHGSTSSGSDSYDTSYRVRSSVEHGGISSGSDIHGGISSGSESYDMSYPVRSSVVQGGISSGSDIHGGISSGSDIHDGISSGSESYDTSYPVRSSVVQGRGVQAGALAHQSAPQALKTAPEEYFYCTISTL